MAIAQAGAVRGHISAGISCAMGMVAFASGDVQTSRALFLKAVAVPSDSLHAIFALCALGLLTSDFNLSLIALGKDSWRSTKIVAEFTKIMAATSPPQHHVVSFFRLGAIFYSLQGLGRRGRNCMLKAYTLSLMPDVI